MAIARGALKIQQYAPNIGFGRCGEQTNVHGNIPGLALHTLPAGFLQTIRRLDESGVPRILGNWQMVPVEQPK